MALLLRHPAPDLPLALDPAIIQAASVNAWFVFSLSGGKDSTAAAHAGNAWLDAMGHPRSRRITVHADLGRAEWETTPATVAAIAESLDLPLLVVRRGAGDLVARWEQRFRNGKARFETLSTYHLIGPWSQANKRFCTSELKAQVIGSALGRRFRGEAIVSIVGVRREESIARRLTPISRADQRFAKPGNAAGTVMLVWNPLVEWTAAEIFDAHRQYGWPLHEAYRCFGSSRLSCRFCVLASLADLRASTRAPANLDHFLHLTGMEIESTFSFQPGRWLGDVAPQLLSSALLRALGRAKQDAERRRTLEAAMPPDLRFVMGWPPRAPSKAEAALIAQCRQPILARHKLADRYPDAGAVIARFDELLAAKADKRAR